jgi:hypothetical protein
MQVGIQNFTDAGNDLMWRSSWEKYQRERCKSKTMTKLENRVHYDRIFNALTDIRSIDVLNKASLKNVKKMDQKEYIIKYINENKDKKSPKELTEAIAIALEVPVEDKIRMRAIFNDVMEQLKAGPPQLAEVSIAIDGKTVPIIADDFGVHAGANPFGFTGVPSFHRDEETGERGVVVWAGDNQAPVREFVYGGLANRGLSDSGDRVFEMPGQFSVPITIPRQMEPITYNRLALPDTNQLENIPTYPTPQRSLEGYAGLAKTLRTSNQREMGGTQTKEFYPSAIISMTPRAVKQHTTGVQMNVKPYFGHITQTAQTGPFGHLSRAEQLKEFSHGGSSRGFPSSYGGMSTSSGQEILGALAQKF